VVQIFGTGDNMYYNSKNNNYSFGPLEANYKEMITWLNKCYTNGLLNEDIFTMTDEAWSAATADDKGYFCIDNMVSVLWAAPMIPDPKDPEKTISPWQIILPPMVNGQRNFGTISHGSIDYNSLWTVAANTKNIDTVCKFFDYVYSDAGNEAWTWGEKDITFTIDEKGVNHFIVDPAEGKG
ncbi:MAG: hypothetical protein M1308_23285, partial [Actinobacteria bacterium]|nr:hypothetical protein [Actinomycetota bacterium]